MSRRRPRRAVRDLLARRPLLTEPPPASEPGRDVVVELQELADLYDRGLLSASEYRRQKQRVLDS